MGGKKKGSGRRRHGDSSSEDELHSEPADLSSSPSASAKDMNFAQRREAQRKAAADKRRAKMKCHLCGKSGHVRRECPGIADDGRGESRHKNAKGDKNARSKASDKKGARNRGRKSSSKKYEEVREVVLPPGFEPLSLAQGDACGDDDGEASQDSLPIPFKYYDAGCDPHATIDYLRSGRGKAKKSMKEALEEYESAIGKAISESNYGGCIARCALETDLDRSCWTPENCAPPIPSQNASNTWYVLGFENAAECDADVLCRAVANNKGRAVGVYADLDYRPTALEKKGMGADDQLSRLQATMRVAAETSVPIQVQVGPSPPTSTASNEEDGENSASPYSSVIVDLGKVLLDSIRKHPALKVHLSCWTGRSEHLTALLNAFPDNVWAGFDAAVTFAKATLLHECVFDMPLTKVVIETGRPQTIPSVATKAQGREAFAHSGLVPFIADAIAAHKKTEEITAESVARAASENFIALYSPHFNEE